MIAAVLATALVGGSLSVIALASPDSPARVDAPLPAPARPAFTIPKPQLLEKSANVSRWASVRRPVTARAQPSPRAATVAELSTRTPEGTANIVLALESKTDANGDVWVAVRLPVLPNDTVGWVPRRDLGGYTLVRTHLEIDLSRLTARLLHDGREVFAAPVGVGQATWPTPTGSFYVRNRLTRYRSAMYGPLAFGTSARSEVLTDWPAGGFIGIHGTDRPELLPGRVSHGCIRLRNADILALDRLMPVGTPITIVE